MFMAAAAFIAVHLSMKRNSLACHALSVVSPQEPLSPPCFFLHCMAPARPPCREFSSPILRHRLASSLALKRKVGLFTASPKPLSPSTEPSPCVLQQSLNAHAKRSSKTSSSLREPLQSKQSFRSGSPAQVTPIFIYRSYPKYTGVPLTASNNSSHDFMSHPTLFRFADSQGVTSR